MKNYAVERILLVMILLLVLIIAVKKCNNKERKNEHLEQIVQLQRDTIVQWKDVAGHSHATRSVEVADIRLLNALHQAEIDSLLALLNLRDRQLEAVTMFSTKTEATVKPKVDTFYKDAKASYAFDYSDNWLRLHGRVGDSNYFKYAIRDSLAITTSRKKKFITVDAFSLNPNTTVTGLTSLKVALPPPKKFSIGPYVGYGWGAGGLKPSFGIALHYNLISF